MALQRNVAPYDECFYPALEKLGVPVVPFVGGRWLLTHALPAATYVHLQFPSFFYSGGRPHTVLAQFARFIALLLLIRARRGKLLWTAHNLFPHERTSVRGIDRLGRRLVIGLSHRVFAHGRHAAEVLTRTFPRVEPKLTLIEHGNWMDRYPNIRSRHEARDRLGLAAGAHVFLFIGACKEYKNVDGLIDTFRGLDIDSCLLIAGQFRNADYLRKITALASGDPRIRLLPRYIADDEIQDFLNAADCVVLPYRDILTSGSGMLPLSFGRPVVSVRMGHLRDIVNEDVGILFDPAEPDGLRRALLDARQRHFDEGRILAHARRFSWERSARAFIDALAS